MAFTNAQKFVSLGMSPELATTVSAASSGAVAEKPQVTALVSLTDSSGGTANDTIAAIPDPADTPASADALRDDLVANTIPALKNAVADLAAKVNAVIAALKA